MGARRRGFLEGFMDLGAKLPWYVSVILAVIVFLLLTWVSKDFFAANLVTSTVDVGHFALHRMIVSIAWYLKWIIPAALLIGGVVCAVRGRRR